MFITPCVSDDTCSMLRVTFHVSGVRCHMSHQNHKSGNFVVYLPPFFGGGGQSGEAIPWRVCYQRGRPRLVSHLIKKSQTQCLVHPFLLWKFSKLEIYTLYTNLEVVWNLSALQGSDESAMACFVHLAVWILTTYPAGRNKPYHTHFGSEVQLTFRKTQVEYGDCKSCVSCTMPDNVLFPLIQPQWGGSYHCIIPPQVMVIKSVNTKDFSKGQTYPKEALLQKRLPQQVSVSLDILCTLHKTLKLKILKK